MSETPSEVVFEALKKVLGCFEYEEQVAATQSLIGSFDAALFEMDEAELVELHTKAVHRCVEAWLDGRAVYDDAPAAVLDLSDAEKADIKNLLKKTQIKSFRFGIHSCPDHYVSACAFKIGKWRARAKWEYCYTREYYDLHSVRDLKPRSWKTTTDFCGVTEVLKKMGTKLRVEKAAFYYYLVAFDHVHRFMSNRPDFQPNFDGCPY